MGGVALVATTPAYAQCFVGGGPTFGTQFCTDDPFDDAEFFQSPFSTIYAFGPGVVTVAFGDDVEIDAWGNIVTGGTGIIGVSFGDDVEINANRIWSYGGSGIIGVAFGGDVEVNAYGRIRADGFAGIGAFAFGGEAEINFEGEDITNYGGFGVFGFGTDGVDIEGRRSNVVAEGTGIFGVALDGDVTIDAGRVRSYDSSGVIGLAFDGDVDIDAHGTIRADGFAGIGAFAFGYRSDATIDFEGETVINRDGLGVIAVADRNVDIEGRRSEVYALGDGIVGTSRWGDVTIDAGNVYAFGNGVVGTAYDGNVDIDAHGEIFAAGFAGIGAFAFDGDANVNFEGERITNFLGNGVVAVAVDGDVDIEGNRSRITSFGTGITATAFGGDVYIDAGRVTSFQGSGIIGTAFGGDVDIDVNGRIEADDGMFGAAAIAYGGNATVTVNAEIDPPLIGAYAATYGWGTAAVYINDDVEAEFIGAFAANYGRGDVVVDTDDDIAAGFTGIQTINYGRGTTDVRIDGDIGGLYAPWVLGDGVNTFAGYGAGQVHVDLDERRSIFARDDGIEINNIFGRGDTYVDVREDAFIFAGDNGIDITAFNSRDVDIDIEEGAGVFAFGRAISVDATRFGSNRDADVDINNDGFLMGRGSFFDPTIYVRTDGTANINNWNDGLIAGDFFSWGALVIDVDGVGDDGHAEIDNYGTIIGRVALTDNDDEFWNYSDQSWRTTGNSYFGAGDDTFHNYGAIYAEDTTLLFGLDTLYNYRGGAIVMQDGDVSEFLATGGDYVGGIDYSEGNFAILAIDAELVGNFQSYSDEFRIIGAASGATFVAVDNLHVGPTSYDPTGTRVVDAGTSGGTGDEFRLLNGPITAGLFTWDLYFDEENDDWWLRNAPNEQATELASIVTLAQFVNQGFTGTWHERTADLRNGTSTGPGGSTGGADGETVDNSNGGIWFRAFGDRLNRDLSTAFSGPSMGFTAPNASQQTTGGFVGGVDKIFDTNSGGVVIGLLGSYQASRTVYSPTGTTNTTTGAGVGGYVSLLSGGLFLDVLAQAQFFDIEHAVGGQFAETANTAGRTYGVIIDGGYRFGDGAVHLEPLATFAYSTTSVDGFTMLENDVTFGTGASALGRLGLRLSATVDGTRVSIQPFVEASAWHQFLGTNSVTLSGDTVDVTLVDATGGTTYRATGGIELQGAGALSGFINGQYTFGNGLSGYGGQAGLRFGF